jgi:hypothetical protein
MSAQNISLQIDDRARLNRFPQPFPQKGMVGSIVNKTDFLAFGFIMNPKTDLESSLSDLLLSMFS